jgi:hypothetical protein
VNQRLSRRLEELERASATAARRTTTAADSPGLIALRARVEAYALDQAMNAAAKVALNPRSPAR